MRMVKRRRKYRRGYAVAILTGLESNRAILWKIFSEVVKLDRTIWLDGVRSDPKAVYYFHESIVNALRPALNEGIRSIILASPSKTYHAQRFIDHIHRYHAWLFQNPNKAVFSEATGSAGTLSEVAALTRTSEFRKLICETTSEESENLVDVLEKLLNASNQDAIVLYSLKEIEGLILGAHKSGKPKIEYLMLTNKYLAGSCEKNRIHRLMQIAANRNIRTRIVDAESAAGLRLTQFGGIVSFAEG